MKLKSRRRKRNEMPLRCDVASHTVLRGEYALGVLTHQRLKQASPQRTLSRVGRLSRRLHLHRQVRKVGRAYWAGTML